MGIDVQHLNGIPHLPPSTLRWSYGKTPSLAPTLAVVRLAMIVIVSCGDGFRWYKVITFDAATLRSLMTATALRI